MTRPWTRSFEMFSEDKDGLVCIRSTFRSFSMPDVRDILKKYKARRAEEGLPKRDLSPITTWLLDASIDEFLESHAKDHVLERIILVDKRN